MGGEGWGGGGGEEGLGGGGLVGVGRGWRGVAGNVG